MADNDPDSRPANVNERTYQEVEYLKKNLGPVLVAALAEICIRRPADPIEYLGHWLLRWRYNEELKRRDVQNALDVVRQKQWDCAQVGTNNPTSLGVTPGYPNLPPGYGGPFEPEEAGEDEEEEEAPPAVENEEQYGEYEGEGLGTVVTDGTSGAAGTTAEGKRASLEAGEAKRASGEAKRASGEAKRDSGEAKRDSGEAKRDSGEAKRASGEDKRASVEDKRASVEDKRASVEAKGGSGASPASGGSAEEKSTRGSGSSADGKRASTGSNKGGSDEAASGASTEK